jgi:Uma2 family endonuclease
MLFILDPVEDERRRPDVAFVAADRWPFDQPIPYQGDWAVVPNLAVEVISPNDALPKVLEKVREYFHFGVQQVWLVIPSERQVYLYEAPARVRILTEADTLDGGTLIPGWKLPLADLFQRRRPAPGAATP